MIDIGQTGPPAPDHQMQVALGRLLYRGNRSQGPSRNDGPKTRWGVSAQGRKISDGASVLWRPQRVTIQFET
jgi:hypothetical protein